VREIRVSLAAFSDRRVDADVAAISRSQRAPVLEQTLLVVVKLLARLRREFSIRPFDDGVDRTSLLAEAAVDAFTMSMS